MPAGKLGVKAGVLFTEFIGRYTIQGSLACKCSSLHMKQANVFADGHSYLHAGMRAHLLRGLLGDLLTPCQRLQVCPIDLLAGELQCRGCLVKRFVIAAFAGFR